MVQLNVLAADIHKRMVDDNRFGYSWSERYGATSENWTVDNVPITISVGDYDCSSSTITAWRLALKAAGVTLGNATYTGNMRSVFLATGLFEWRYDFANAKRGDLYLNETNHVAMCQGGGKLSEFSSNEHGGAYGGQRGDQTGWEAHIANYYNYPWNGYLHYIGTKEVGVSEERTVWLYENNMTDAQKWWHTVNKDGSYTFKSKSCGLVLDVQGAGTKDGTAIQAYPANGTKAQSFKIKQLGKPYSPTFAAPVELVPCVNEKARVDVAGGNPANGTKIQLYKANNTNAQRWVVLDDGKGYWTFVNVATGKALDVKSGGK